MRPACPPPRCVRVLLPGARCRRSAPRTLCSPEASFRSHRILECVTLADGVMQPAESPVVAGQVPPANKTGKKGSSRARGKTVLLSRTARERKHCGSPLNEKTELFSFSLGEHSLDEFACFFPKQPGCAREAGSPAPFCRKLPRLQPARSSSTSSTAATFFRSCLLCDPEKSCINMEKSPSIQWDKQGL